MKHLKVAEARARFGDILDEAERGVPVYIERRGVRFKVVAETAETPRAATAAEIFAFVDADVMSGDWTWAAGRKGLKFSPRRKSR
jgi:prevent-host-death family protein